MISVRPQSGIAYIGLLFALTLIGIALSQMLPVLSQQTQREKEAQLLWIGQQYQTAIQSYYVGSPGTIKQYPKEISDLLEDRRVFGIRRHLRKPYPDPITGQLNWGMLKAADGGIKAIFSTSSDIPLKQAEFPEGLERLKGTSHYSDWVFGDVS